MFVQRWNRLNVTTASEAFGRWCTWRRTGQENGGEDRDKGTNDTRFESWFTSKLLLTAYLSYAWEDKYEREFERQSISVKERIWNRVPLMDTIVNRFTIKLGSGSEFGDSMTLAALPSCSDAESWSQQ